MCFLSITDRQAVVAFAQIALALALSIIAAKLAILYQIRSFSLLRFVFPCVSFLL